mmetsp:Transcript_34645/g.80891  ORF Transcript_34645/g.80891 Transcript_34645/m.80891 type:complete len:349 (-) Transcript_34645:67-1113(-)
MGCSPAKGKEILSADPNSFKQTIVILRHSERWDQMDPEGYKQSEEGKAWPFDTSLTANGIKLAQSVAKELAELHSQVHFSAVVSSPYRRCMQTAAEVAHLCKLPFMIDQELGEVWEEAMPQAGPPHRSPKQLQQMAAELRLDVQNPLLNEGGFKLFGIPPQKWPETIEQGHKRCMVRVEHYIDLSTSTKQNFIIVSHAPAVAALADLFQRGACDISKLEYCARVVAQRQCKDVEHTPTSPNAGKTTTVFADEWTVSSQGVVFELNIDATESCFLRGCNKHWDGVTQRQALRSGTDSALENTIRKLNEKENGISPKDSPSSRGKRKNGEKSPAAKDSPKGKERSGGNRL